MPTKSSGAAVQRAERAVLAAALLPREVYHHITGNRVMECRICWGAMRDINPLRHESTCPVLALQRARAAARKKGTR